LFSIVDKSTERPAADLATGDMRRATLSVYGELICDRRYTGESS